MFPNRFLLAAAAIANTGAEPVDAAPRDPEDPTQSMERELAALELEMPDLQHRHRDVFSYANAWAERHDALVRDTPMQLRPLLEQRLHRIGVRWGVASGARMTSQFPAIKLPV